MALKWVPRQSLKDMFRYDSLTVREYLLKGMSCSYHLPELAYEPLFVALLHIHGQYNFTNLLVSAVIILWLNYIIIILYNDDTHNLLGYPYSFGDVYCITLALWASHIRVTLRSWMRWGVFSEWCHGSVQDQVYWYVTSLAPVCMITIELCGYKSLIYIYIVHLYQKFC